MKRGVLYIVWGEEIMPLLQRSINSVQTHCPNLPIHVVRGQSLPARALEQKSRMVSLTPFESTLYLDADTIVMGNLDYAFDRAEEYGLACCICECPWLRRYDQSQGDRVEYNTGVLFFAPQARPVFELWQSLAPTYPSTSRVQWGDTSKPTVGVVEFDDQASFGHGVRECGFNPYVLPLNYNFRPLYHRTGFAPLKIWHDRKNPPQPLVAATAECERGQWPVTFFEFNP